MEIQESISPARETEILSAHGTDAEIIPTQLIMSGDMQSIMPAGVEQRARIGEDASQPNVPRSVETAQPRAASSANTACLPRPENFSSDHLTALDAKTDKCLQLLGHICAILADNDPRLAVLAPQLSMLTGQAPLSDAVITPMPAPSMNSVPLKVPSDSIVPAQLTPPSAPSTDTFQVLPTPTVAPKFNGSRIPTYKGMTDTRSIDDFLRQCSRALASQEIPEAKWVQAICPLITEEVMVMLDCIYPSQMDIHRLSWTEFGNQLRNCMAPAMRSKDYQAQLAELKQSSSENAWAYLARATTLLKTLEKQVSPAVLYVNDTTLRLFINGFSHAQTRGSLHTWFAIYRDHYGVGAAMFSQLVAYTQKLLEPSNRSMSTPSASAAAAQASSSSSGKPRGKGAGSAQGKGNAARGSKKPREVRCYYCQEKGHVKPDCPAWKATQDRYSREEERHTQLLAALQTISARSSGNE